MKTFFLKLFLFGVIFNNYSLLSAQSQLDTLDTVKRISDLFNKGVPKVYSKPDSAIKYITKAKELALKLNDTGWVIKCNNSISLSAGTKNDLYLMKKVLDETNQYKIENQVKRQSLYETALFNNAMYHYMVENFKTSNNYLLQAIQLINTDSIPPKTVIKLRNRYNFIAKNFVNQGKYMQAKNYYNNSIRLLETHNLPPKQKLRTQALLAEVLKQQQHYKASNKILKRTIDDNISLKNNSRIIITEANHIIDNYLALNQVDSTAIYIEIINQQLNELHPFRHKYFEALARVNTTKKDYDQAITQYKKALILLHKKWQNQPHNQIADTYFNIGKNFERKGEQQMAIRYFDSATSIFNTKNNAAFNKTLHLSILKHKASSILKLQKHKQAYTITKYACNLLDTLKPTFKTQDDKLFLIDNAYSIFDTSLQALYNLNQQKSEDSLINNAFYVLEKSKSILLLEALLGSRATAFANIPKSITEREEQLKAKIANLDKKLVKRQSNALNDERFNTQVQYDKLIDSIETNYPNYYNLKYNNKVLNISDIQKQLQSDQGIVSYFYGNDAIFSIAITSQNTYFNRLHLSDTLKQNLITYQRLVNTPKSDIKALQKLSKYLYNTLLNSNQLSTVKRLTIIPDGALNYIPFESLTTANNTFLIEETAVSYINSMSLMEQLNATPQSNSVLAFAPSFAGESDIDPDRSKLLPLPHNSKEVENILSYFKGRSYYNQDATLSNFLSQEQQYNILHLATHAVFNDTIPDFSYLAFTPQKQAPYLLYANDIYNTKINADLVTLSACETGIGDLKRGEGFLSLSRSFFYSGAKSLASTLWKVNDASSAKLMSNFYNYLSQDNTKDIALQQAKLKFLKDNKDTPLSHPYYWSGFILSGNTAALSPNTPWFLYLGIGLLVLIGLWIVKRQLL